MANLGIPSENDLSHNCSDAEGYEKRRDMSNRHLLPNDCQHRRRHPKSHAAEQQSNTSPEVVMRTSGNLTWSSPWNEISERGEQFSRGCAPENPPRRRGVRPREEMFLRQLVSRSLH